MTHRLLFMNTTRSVSLSQLFSVREHRRKLKTIYFYFIFHYSHGESLPGYLCEVSSTDCPRCVAVVIHFQASRRVAASIPVVGSSCTQSAQCLHPNDYALCDNKRLFILSPSATPRMSCLCVVLSSLRSNHSYTEAEEVVDLSKSPK